jgi:hypothetical protein
LEELIDVSMSGKNTTQEPARPAPTSTRLDEDAELSCPAIHKTTCKAPARQGLLVLEELIDVSMSGDIPT